MLRTMAEFVSRRVVLKRRLPEFFDHAPLFVSPGSALSYWRRNVGKSSSTLFDVLQNHVRAGQVVWDIGANVGVFSLAAATLVGPKGRVLCVEPDEWLVRLLRQSNALKENHELPLDILPVAVTDRLDIVKLNIARRGRSANYVAGTLGSSQTGGVRASQLVPSVSLDWLLERYPRPDFVKIDVEGCEYKVLMGASRLLTEIKPVIFCEVASELSEDVATILGRHGYSLYDFDTGNELSLAPPYAAWNTLACPPGFSP